MLLGLACLSVALTFNSGDAALFPAAPGDPVVEIELVSNGFHSGLMVPRTALRDAAERLHAPALIALTQRFEFFPYLEIGWGEEVFYPHTPTAGSLDLWLALRALFRPGNSSVLHIVGFEGRASDLLNADVVSVALSQRGFDALAQRLETSFVADDQGPVSVGPGLYGLSQFYRSRETFGILHLCNHWTAQLLSAAGIPTVGLLATLPVGLIADLRWRSGLR